MRTQRMLLKRYASICSRWKQHGEVLLPTRSASGSSAKEDVNFTELAEKPKPSASNTDGLFGIAPRKVIDEEDEDFVPPNTPKVPSTVGTPTFHNYFSKTWAMQKSVPVIRAEAQSVPPSQHAHLPQLIPTHRSILNRTWQVTPDLQACNHETFKFVSLKVLSTAIATKHKGQLYSYAAFSVLDWKSRRRKLLADLAQYSADVICLQELDMFHDLQSDLSLMGYDGLYKRSTGRSPCGCAIFWNQRRFQLLHEESIDFSMWDMRSNVAQLCVLQSAVPGTTDNEASSTSRNHDQNQRKCLIVGNIDALFNPRRGDIKLGQCRVFLQKAHRLSNQWPGAPLVIGGCFHATPQSAIYKFLAESKLDVSGLSSRYLSGHFSEPAKSSESPLTSSGTNLAFDKKRGEDLSQTLRKSLLARTTSKQYTHTVGFGNSASLRSSCANRRPTRKDAKSFVSKTMEFLESSIKSKEASEVMDENATGVDVSPGACFSKTMEFLESSIKSKAASEVTDENATGVDASPGGSKSSESETDLNTNSADFKSIEPPGNTVELESVEFLESSVKSKEALEVVDENATGVDVSPGACVSKTMEFLESSIKSKAASEVTDENATGVDGSPGASESSESETYLNTNSIDFKSIEPSGITVELESRVNVALNHHLPGDEAPKYEHSVALDAAQKEASDVISSTTCDLSGSSSTPEHGWDPEALRIASGFTDCTVVKHDLKLFSVYPEVQGEASTRDSKGEPCMTMSHNEFKGTVDYIWRSEGLKTMKVLDTFSKNAMLMTHDIPFKVSGSDHVSLACELGFYSS